MSGRSPAKAWLPLRPLRRPRLWAGLWWALVVAAVGVCLLPGPDLPDVPEGGDKLEHAFGFFVLMAAAVQVFDGTRAWWRAAVLLVLVGIGIEIAQGVFTTTRNADSQDVLADAIGVLLGLATAGWRWGRELLWRCEPGRRR